MAKLKRLGFHQFTKLFLFVEYKMSLAPDKNVSCRVYHLNKWFSYVFLLTDIHKLHDFKFKKVKTTLLNNWNKYFKNVWNKKFQRNLIDVYSMVWWLLEDCLA